MSPYRLDRILREQRHDTYKAEAKLSEPAHCPDCGLSFHKGRWQRLGPPKPDSAAHVCSACHRIRDNYPAGELILSGDFVAAHADELTRLARNTEALENDEHPLNRIVALERADDSIRITTTDLHLPARIGRAVESAFEGDLNLHYDEEGYFSSVRWHRDS